MAIRIHRYRTSGTPLGSPQDDVRLTRILVSIVGAGSGAGVLKITVSDDRHEVEFLVSELDHSPVEPPAEVDDLRLVDSRPNPEPEPAVFQSMPTSGTRVVGAAQGKPRGDASALLTTRDGVVVQRLVVDADQARPVWADLFRQAGTTGIWPVIVADETSTLDDSLPAFIESARDTSLPPADAVLEAAVAVDAEALLRRLWDDLREDDSDPEAWDFFDETAPSGSVPPIPSRVVPNTGLATIALVPAASSEDILAVLGWGDFNGCPPPHEHTAVLRLWRERYGARLEAIAIDTLELAVERPPSTFEAALSLAREQCGYAPDIVVQGDHETVGELAAALIDSRHWHLWWD